MDEQYETIQIHDDDIARMRDCVDIFQGTTVVVCGHPDASLLGLLFYLMRDVWEDIGIEVDDLERDNATARLITWTGDSSGWPDRDLWAVFPMPLDGLIGVFQECRFLDTRSAPHSNVPLRDKIDQLRAPLEPGKTFVLIVERADEDGFCASITQTQL